MAPQTSHFSNDDLSVSKLFDVSHLKCVVTGGATGIGLMCTQALAANGATVYIIGRREETLKKAAEKYSSGSKGKIIPLAGDISSKDECVRLAKEIAAKEAGGIHLLVNNAGIARDDATKLSENPPDSWEDAESLSKHMLQSEPEAWLETFKTNVVSPFFMAAALVPSLAKANQNAYEPFPGIKYTSSIVNISSISGLMKGSSSGGFDCMPDDAAATDSATRTICIRKLQSSAQAAELPHRHASQGYRYPREPNRAGCLPIRE